MAIAEVKLRSEMDSSLQWNLEDLYQGYAAWAAALAEVQEMCSGF